MQVVKDAVKLGKEIAIADARADVYEAACNWTEQLEALGHHRGNGHHTAQEVAAFMAKLIEERWQS